jgi:hypothetical protein
VNRLERWLIAARGLRVATSAVLCIATVFLAAGRLTAATIFIDNFESYADTAALDAVWPVGAGNNTMTFLDTGPAGSTNTSKVVHSTNRLGRRDRSFTPTVPTATMPLVVTYDLYDTTAAADAANEYNQVLAFNGATLTQLISMGKSTLATSNGANNPAKYQARVAFPAVAGGGVNWINLNANRLIGWHTFTAEIFDTTVNFYVDGVLDTANVPRSGGVGDPFNVARIGSGLSIRAEEGFYDNFSVVQVPEPGTMVLAAAAAGLLLICRRLFKR